MNTFVNAIGNAISPAVTVLTENGAKALSSTENKVLDLFYTIGASRGKDIVPLFVEAFKSNPDQAIRVALWARDVRGGAGERDLFKQILSHVETINLELFTRVATKALEVGRADDILVAKSSGGIEFVSKLILSTINTELTTFGKSNVAKWMPRKGPWSYHLRTNWSLTKKQYRKFIVGASETVEQKMCAKKWNEIDYSTVPSLAMARYTKAFGKNDYVNFENYKHSIANGEAKVNASAVYPYDVTKTLRNGDAELAQAQWDALPNFLLGAKIMPMVDVSGSMTTPVAGGKTTAMEIAISLGLYIADKQQGAFNGVTMSFSGDSELTKFNSTDLLEDKVNTIRGAKWGMNTNIRAAFENLLVFANQNGVTSEDMPETLLILSDMEFDASTRPYTGYYRDDNFNHDDYIGTTMEEIEKLYSAMGYKVPKLVFWNLTSRLGHSPVKKDKHGVALVSGFSPSILKTVLSATEFDPVSIMLDTILVDRYDY